mmetsp:Transcript_45228/g.139519  ORF Transcript_45228/g.139519 Transcript_45228/m.139519 type:complete len:257 (-) Transcript_45228:345-1115(-)
MKLRWLEVPLHQRENAKQKQLVLTDDPGQDRHHQQPDFEAFGSLVQLGQQPLRESLWILQQPHRVDKLTLLSSIGTPIFVKTLFKPVNFVLQDTLPLASLRFVFQFVLQPRDDATGILFVAVAVRAHGTEFRHLHHEEVQRHSKDECVSTEARGRNDLNCAIVAPQLSAVQIDHDCQSATRLHRIIILHHFEQEALNVPVHLRASLLRTRKIDPSNIVHDVAENDLSQRLVAALQQAEENRHRQFNWCEVFVAQQN